MGNLWANRFLAVTAGGNWWIGGEDRAADGRYLQWEYTWTLRLVEKHNGLVSVQIDLTFLLWHRFTWTFDCTTRNYCQRSTKHCHIATVGVHVTWSRYFITACGCDDCWSPESLEADTFKRTTRLFGWEFRRADIGHTGWTRWRCSKSRWALCHYIPALVEITDLSRYVLFPSFAFFCMRLLLSGRLTRGELWNKMDFGQSSWCPNWSLLQTSLTARSPLSGTVCYSP